MDLSLRERFERVASTRAIDRELSGSPAALVLSTQTGNPVTETISAMEILVRRGARLFRAKRTVEEMTEDGRAFIRLPAVESVDALIAELAKLNIVAAECAFLDVRALRESLGLSVAEFAARFGLASGAVARWESGDKEPDAAARSYLQAISNDPESVRRAYLGSQC